MAGQFKIHAACRGNIETDYHVSPRAAARSASAAARAGCSATVFRGSAVMMICDPGKRRRTGSRTASCRVVEPSFKARLKGRRVSQPPQRPYKARLREPR